MNIHSQLLLNRFTRSMMFSCNALHSATCGNSESLAHVQVQTRLKRFAAADVKKGPGHPFLAGPNKCFHSVKMAGFQEAPVALMGDFNIKPGMRHCESERVSHFFARKRLPRRKAALSHCKRHRRGTQVEELTTSE